MMEGGPVRLDPLLSLLLALCCCLPGRGMAAPEILRLEKSLYRNVLVYEENHLRCMKFGAHDTGRQTCVSLKDPEALVFNPPKMLLAALYLRPNPGRVLVIGLGGGTVTVTLQKLFPELPIDSVEIDPAVVKVAKEFFGFVPGKNTRVFVDDGRVFVKHALRQKRKYDLVILDAFDHISVPEHMTTREYLLEIRGLMEPGGVFAANTFSSGRLYDAESATYFAVFGGFYNLKVFNRVILAQPGGLPDMETIRRNAEGLEGKFQPFSTGKGWLLPLFASHPRWPPQTRLLTDQYSPANLLNGR
ncbi:MAG: fused MFS/spermidine synthase [Magnetococcales bacterium]|nr:fused MFS/spermidine synthase [Magnetococcales bacterium]